MSELPNVKECLASLLASASAAEPRAPRPLFVGLSGAQGSGKSTAAEALAAERPGIAVLGLDDFYLTRAERTQLAAVVSPLLETRGPPGTHDISLLLTLLGELAAGKSVQAPVFSKVADDRVKAFRTLDAIGPGGVVLLEGWMVGALPPPDFVTGEPLNELEQCDEAGTWRRYQYEQLQGPYQALWDRMDAFIYLETPDFDTVVRWRSQQEATNFGVEAAALPPQRVRWVEEFVQYYQRLTLGILARHRRPGAVVRLDAERRVQGVVDWPAG